MCQGPPPTGPLASACTRPTPTSGLGRGHMLRNEEAPNDSGTTSGKGDRFLKTSPGLRLSVRFPPPPSRPPSPNPNPSLSPQSLSELPVLPSGLEEKRCQPLGPLIGPHLRCNSCHLRVLFQQLKDMGPSQWHLPCFSDSLPRLPTSQPWHCFS